MKEFWSKYKSQIIKIAISVTVLAIIVFLGYIILKNVGVIGLTEQELEDYISSTGAVAPLVFIAVSFLQVTFIPIPGAITIIAGNFLFGFFKSFLYSYIGMMLGSLFAFFLGRKLGRAYINWVIGDVAKVDEWIKRLKGKEKVFLFFAFLLPLFPDDILCTIAGMLPISWLTFIVMQLITRVTSIGATLLFMSGEIIPYSGWGLIVLGILALISIIAFIVSLKYSEKINKFFDNFVNKMSSKLKRNDVNTDKKE